MQSRQISPAVAGILVVVALVAVVAGGIWYMSRSQQDPVAEAAWKQRKAGGGQTTYAGPPMGAPPKAGASDYAPAGPMPPKPGR